MSAQKRLVNFRHSITSGNSRANVCHGVDFDVPLPITAGLERQARFHPGCTLTLDEKLRAVSGRIVLYLSAFNLRHLQFSRFRIFQVAIPFKNSDAKLRSDRCAAGSTICTPVLLQWGK